LNLAKRLECVKLASALHDNTPNASMAGSALLQKAEASFTHFKRFAIQPVLTSIERRIELALLCVHQCLSLKPLRLLMPVIL